jgi:ABC-type uncharacterized transport system involved in gliding motility auxiliary subunit
MGNSSFQVFLFFVLAFSSSYAAKHPICLDQDHIMEAKSISELEQMVHPLCLKEKVNLIHNREYVSLKDWKRAYQFLEMAERLPKAWIVFHKALPFLEADSSKMNEYDKAWALIENQENQKLLSTFLEKQNFIKSEIKDIDRTQAASNFLKKNMPFL